jgi:hypothetical protein
VSDRGMGPKTVGLKSGERGSTAHGVGVQLATPHVGALRDRPATHRNALAICASLVSPAPPSRHSVALPSPVGPRTVSLRGQLSGHSTACRCGFPLRSVPGGGPRGCWSGLRR